LRPKILCDPDPEIIILDVNDIIMKGKMNYIVIATSSGAPQYDAFYDPENEGVQNMSMKQFMIVCVDWFNLASQIAKCNPFVKFADETYYVM